jgi:cytochrome P450
MLAVEDEGDRLGPQELLANCILLLLAGHETTMNLIGNGTLALLRHPEQLAALRDDPDLARPGVEELLRYDSPVQLTARTALEDTPVAGITAEKGDQVILLLGAANRDPAVFSEPDRLDLRRDDNRHVAFGNGIHFCLGAPLARIEGQVAIPTLLRRFPGLRLAGEPQWRAHVTLRGLETLPVAVS